MTIHQHPFFPIDQDVVDSLLLESLPVEPQPTEDERMPPEVVDRLVGVIRHEQALREDAAALPEQELCPDCALDDDPATEAGVPQDVVSRSVEEQRAAPGEWDAEAWGQLPAYDVVLLACGHTTSRLA